MIQFTSMSSGPIDPSQSAQQGPRKERPAGPPRFTLPTTSTRQGVLGRRLLGGDEQRAGQLPASHEDGDKYDPKRPLFTFGQDQATALEQLLIPQGVDLKPYKVFRDDPALHGQVFHRMETTIQIPADELFALASTHGIAELIGQEVIVPQLVNQYQMPQQVQRYEQQRHLQQGQTFEHWEQEVYFTRDLAVQQLQTSFAALAYERLVQQTLPDFQLVGPSGSRETLQLDPINLEGKAALVTIYNTEVAAALASGQARSDTQRAFEEARILDMGTDEYRETMGGIADEVPPEVAAVYDLPESQSGDLASSLAEAVENLRESVTSITGSGLRTDQIMATLTTHAQTAADLVEAAQAEEAQQDDPGATQPMTALPTQTAPTQHSQAPRSLPEALKRTWELLTRAGIDPTEATTAQHIPVVKFRRPPPPVWEQPTLPTSGPGSLTREEMDRALEQQGHPQNNPPSSRRDR